MSVLVKGMKMPENCSECIRSDLRTTIKCTEWTEISAGRRENERAWSCPLVEIPEKHGRLIDEDDIDIPSLETSYDQVLVYGAIREAPTIIEAEEGD